MLSDTIVVLGHSHLIAMQDALATSHEPDFSLTANIIQLWKPEFSPNVIWHQDQLRYNTNIDGAVQASCDAKAIFTNVLGAEHFLWALQGRSFDFVIPDIVLPRVPDAEIVPFNLIKQFAHDNLIAFFELNKHLNSLTGVPVYHILPPPPVANQDRMFATAIAHEPLRQKIILSGPPHPVLRYKLWLLWTIVARDVADAAGVHVIMPPPAACNGQGFLLDHYSADFVHANARYGALVWQQIKHVLLEESDHGFAPLQIAS